MRKTSFKIGFNSPFRTGNELRNIDEAFKNHQLSGDGYFTDKCHRHFEEKYGFRKALLTTSCTDALEMAALLLDIRPGDEVIVPGYTFVSTANAFVLRGAEIVFADSLPDHPNVDPESVQRCITSRTKAIVPVHYAGVACDMDTINALAAPILAAVVEDAAQAIDAYYRNKPLGSIGTLGAFSFHETKNIYCGEGGMLTVNDPNLIKRAEIIREKGTNRSAFFRGEVDKYTWVDIGSSFLPGEMAAAFLHAQLEQTKLIQDRRVLLWNHYYRQLAWLEKSEKVKLPVVHDYATNNGHLFYLVCADIQLRDGLIRWLNERGVQALFHYQPLHLSPYYLGKHQPKKLPNCERFASCIVRLPLYHELKENEIDLICESIVEYFSKA